jgi:hypothetical protein
MRHLLFRIGLAASGALLLASCAGAQYGSYRNYPYRGGGPYGDGYYDRGYDRGYRGFDVIDRALGDLDRVQDSAWRGGHRGEFDQARKDLIRFRENSMRGRFDRDRLDGAIEHMNRLAGSDRIAPRARDLLSRDVYALRDFRSRGAYSDRRY